MIIDSSIEEIQEFIQLLTHFSEIQVQNHYIELQKAVEKIAQDQPELIFLSVDFPNISLNRVVKMLYSLVQDVQIVFLSEDSHYAVQAYELNIMDYLIYPATTERLQLTIERVLERQEYMEAKRQLQEPIVKPNQIRLFKSLTFYRADDLHEPIEVTWRTAKAKAVFLYLLQHEGQVIQKEVLLDTFWPEMEMKKATAQLYSTIYQIRKVIQDVQFAIDIKSNQGNYLLTMQAVEVDVSRWKQQIEKLKEITSETIGVAQKLVREYSGDYLQEVDYVWASIEREFLRVRWLALGQMMGAYYRKNSLYDEAIVLAHQYQTVDPTIEEVYLRLMKYYEIIGEFSLVKMQYEKLQKMCHELFNSPPREDITKWYRHYQQRVIAENKR